MKTVKQVLIEARELISVPERWTQGAMAQDAKGQDVNDLSSQAVCWCSLGACEKAGMGGNAIAAHSAIRLLEDAIGGDVADFNDQARHSEVLAMFDKAIAAA